jgi:hypothetical protein
VLGRAANDGETDDRYHRRMRLLTVVPVAVTMSACFVAACGSDVSVTSSGQGGSTANGTGSPSGSVVGAGAGTTGTTSGPVGSTATSSGSGVGGGAACDAYCAKADQLGCEAGDCITQCAQAMAELPDCTSELATLLTCMTQLATTCDDLKEPPPGCGEAANAFALCANGGCLPGPCRGGSSAGGQEQCDCTATCNGAMIDVSCISMPGAGAKCDCFVNGQLVGSCGEQVSTFCSIDAGCCSMFF